MMSLQVGMMALIVLTFQWFLQRCLCSCFSSESVSERSLKTEVKNKYGICLVYPSSILKGHLPTIKTAIDKTSYFINQAREIHGDKYDYSKVKFISATLKIKINCFLVTLIE